MKCAQNENFWSYRLHKLDTPKVLQRVTRPAFAKATQMKRPSKMRKYS